MLPKLTEKETSMLKRFLTNDYLAGNLNGVTWSWSIVDGHGHGGAAVLGSLTKKGLVHCCGQGEDATCELTDLGREAIASLV